MRILVKTFLALLVLFVAAFFGFYFWAGSPVLTADELATLQHFNRKDAPTAPLEDEFTIVTYNVGYFSGMANNLPVSLNKDYIAGNLAMALKALKPLKPDIIAMQEIDFDAARSAYQDQLAAVANGFNSGQISLEMFYGAKAVNWNKTYVPFPYWPPSVQFGHMVSGQAILSSHKFSDHQRHVLLKRQDKPFFYRKFYIDRLAQCVIVDLGRPLAVINVHLESWDRKTRGAQIRQVAEFVRQMQKKAPVILLGDFNTVPVWADKKTGYPDEFQDYAGEETLLVVMNDLGLKPAFDKQSFKGDQSGTLTFPSAAPTRKLDHIFYDPEAIEPISRRVVKEAGSASDHLPVAMTFRFKQ